jgi:hypothetical protein
MRLKKWIKAVKQNLKRLKNRTMEHTNNNLVSYCGFYCGACPKYTKGQCEGCKGDNQKCALGYKACQVRPCCIENGFSSCAECDKYESVKDCKIYNPFMIRFGQFITRTNRRLGIEWFPGILSAILLLPVLPSYLFWGRTPHIWHIFRFPPGILFPFSQKQGIFSR